MSLIQHLRQPKIVDIAVFDVAATAAAAHLVKDYFEQPFLVTFILLLIFGVIVHVMLDIPTMGNYYLGLNTQEAVLKNR